ncbi:MAG: ribokinase [Phycisphaeraceae bacterium]|nr:ribokinase [Phycisphaeraceae bacterium]
MIVNIGSLNIDYVYQVDSIVMPGQTLAAASRAVYAGGKGANQSVAIARAGGGVMHVGCIGPDGLWLKEQLAAEGIDTRHIRQVEEATGHAIIQVDQHAENAIIILAGANQCIEADQVQAALAEAAGPDAWVLLQNEVALGARWLDAAAEAGLGIALNPAPMNERVGRWPLEKVDLLVVNQSEAQALLGESKSAEGTLRALERRIRPAGSGGRRRPIIALTLGAEGSMVLDDRGLHHQAAFPAKVCDTTAAGDTWIGYFLTAISEGHDTVDAARWAACAGAICVERPGAIASIPTRAEVDRRLAGTG